MAGKKGFGSKLSYSVDGVLGVGTTFVDLAQMTKLKPFDAKADVLDVTAHDSPADSNGFGWREKLAGLIDAGGGQAELNYDDKATTHKFCLANIGKALTIKITGPGGTPATATFIAFFKQVSPEYPMDKQLACAVSFEISGMITVA